MSSRCTLLPRCRSDALPIGWPAASSPLPR
uniref:Uncharacterized protein n=1 Tax=Siphoviridae sp. ctGO42 TaxID=2827566 RepID=A0A8S5LJ36_9CAUD|nr:MAG TPA: hypothetical protein [Siphoviridae sp. ctGO42]